MVHHNMFRKAVLFSRRFCSSSIEKGYPIPESFLVNAAPHHIQNFEKYKEIYHSSIMEPDTFWSSQAKKLLYWKKPWNRALDFNFDINKGKVYVEWFKGGLTNACYNALDRWVESGQGDRIAYYEEPNLTSESNRVFTYSSLLEQVQRLSSFLKHTCHIRKGDTIAIYLPNIPELPISMLASCRIGAIHSVVFAGFSAQALAERIMDCKASVLITCDGFQRGTKTVHLKRVADEALEIVKNTTSRHHFSVKHQIVLQHLKTDPIEYSMHYPRDIYWHEALSSSSAHCPVEWVDAEHPILVLYTSGSTGKPKGVVQATAGYQLHAASTFLYSMNYHLGDVFFASADCGWMLGHSFMVYGSLANGATHVIYSGLPTYPDPGRTWAIVDKYQVNQFLGAPTLIRSLLREGNDYVKKHSRKSLKLLCTAGEPINPHVWKWYYETVGDSRCPVVDTWWQTETSGVMLLPPPVEGFIQKPGSAGVPFFGILPKIFAQTENGKMEESNQGTLCIARPWPGILRTLLNNHQRFEETYFHPFPGYYYTGDGCVRDEDGCYWLSGRIDDVIGVSGRRIGTTEVESALVSHPHVAEAAVVPIPHEIKGQAVYAFVTLRANVESSENLHLELRQVVREKIGAHAIPEMIQWSPALPKTRSGKIVRRILRIIAERGHTLSPSREELGDTSTLADPQVIEELIQIRVSLMNNKKEVA
ncbi:hypothetical protein GpartN1_g6659.t1 [Galdieria partita]|uniref:Acetyl-coenzyme A synthetase n=1 Tax=Galdieria partita TaxID=83374 RepID=A0A9C7Q1Q6_9RHOD|nr:hypothetical protein GpartN1_g942.t1 [Galdieria partita]GJQ14868.1 hypothetical protein GpartN1_g6659.t1 [Galdieria partita]